LFLFKFHTINKQFLLLHTHSIGIVSGCLKHAMFQLSVVFREKQLTDERNRAKEDELRRREVELCNKDLQFDQRLQNEMAQ
jgi:hypothetical protein